jgi:branched-chain amino acid transport system permease protein
MDIFLQQIINGLVQGSIYALVALGYTMVYGIMGLINFAHGEVVMIGTLVTITVAGTLIKAGMPVALAAWPGSAQRYWSASPSAGAWSASPTVRCAMRRA